MPDRPPDAARAATVSAPMAALAKGRVFRILGWSGVLASAWVVLIQVWAPAITQPQNQFVGNVTEAERFVYGMGDVPAMVVGSSMVESIDVLTSGRLQVLGMNGMSAREALLILLRSGRSPRQVAVELNGLTAPPNDAFVDRVFNPFWMPIRRNVLAMRTEYQPASVIMSLAKTYLGRGATRGGAPAATETVADVRIAQLRELYKQPPDIARLRESLVVVRDAVEALERAGVHVTYFEYPVPHGLSKTAFHDARRAATAEILGEKASAAIRFQDDDFRTRDGIHLDHEGHEAVARALETSLLGSSAADVVE
jgi:hypothetical protein